GLPAGTYDLTISLDGYLTQTVNGVTVTAGGAANEPVLALVPAATVSGTLSSDDPATPAAGTLIGVYRATGALLESATTDAAGNFSFDDLAAGTYTLKPVNVTG